MDSTAGLLGLQRLPLIYRKSVISIMLYISTIALPVSLQYDIVALSASSILGFDKGKHFHAWGIGGLTLRGKELLLKLFCYRHNLTALRAGYKDEGFIS